MCVRRFQRGLVCKAHKFLGHSTLGSRVMKRKKKTLTEMWWQPPGSLMDTKQQWLKRMVVRDLSSWGEYRGHSKLRTHTVLGSYSRAMPRSIGPP